MRNNGHILAPQQPQIVNMTPMNDLQVVAMLAAQLEGSNAERADAAWDLLAEVVAANKRKGLAERINEKGK